MLATRKSADRGTTKIDWLDSRHSFSFGDYHDPANMSFGPLRVINEDWVKAGAGFPNHGHADMEILTWVLEGALEHKDSLGTGSTIRPGDAQRMTAGLGIRHSEFNASKSEAVHLLQIWLLPERRGLKPSYEQKTFAPAELAGQLRLIGSRDGRAGSITIHQDCDLYAARLGAGQQVGHALKPGRKAWVQVARGAATVNGSKLEAGDGAAVSDVPKLNFVSGSETELLTFDMGRRAPTPDFAMAIPIKNGFL